MSNNSKYSVLSPEGFSNFHGLKETEHNQYLELHFSHENENEDIVLKCSMDHRIKSSAGVFFKAKDLYFGFVAEGDFVLIDIVHKREKILMYDLLGVEKKSEYYTNGLVSHNCSFLGSAHTLIGSKYITMMAPKVPLHYKDKLAIYDFPQQDHQYIITVDTSRGKGIDYSAFSVIDITEYPYRQVAVFRDNEISPSLYPDIIARVAMNYNNAFLLIENNDAGGQVVSLLHYDIEYENIISPSTVDPEMGIKMTKSVKRIGCFAFKDLIENGKLIINDINTIEEISTFVRKKDSYEAEDGMHDDIVMGFVLFGWLTSSKIFEEISDHSLRSKMIEERLKKMEEDMLPPFFIDDGINSDPFENADLFVEPEDRMGFEYAGGGENR